MFKPRFLFEQTQIYNILQEVDEPVTTSSTSSLVRKLKTSGSIYST